MIVTKGTACTELVDPSGVFALIDASGDIRFQPCPNRASNATHPFSRLFLWLDVDDQNLHGAAISDRYNAWADWEAQVKVALESNRQIWRKGDTLTITFE